MAETKIEWATHTINWQTGCTQISEACQHCYAIPMSVRNANMGGRASPRYRGVTNGDLSRPRWNGVLKWDEEAMDAAFMGLKAARKPRRVFVGSMTDLFHDDAPADALAALASHLPHVPAQHVLMLLTKRPQNLLAWQRRYFPDGLPSTVAVGTTAENQKRYDERLPFLAQVEAAVRFLSCEPLFTALDLRLAAQAPHSVIRRYIPIHSRIQWVIAGGESGRFARPSHPEWFRSLRDQCEDHGIPFLFKQWGEWAPRGPEPHHPCVDGVPRVRLSICGCNSSSDQAAYGVPGAQSRHDCDLSQDSWMQRIGKIAAGRTLDGVTHDGLPEGWIAKAAA